jgi:hypothetical protein
MPAPKRRRENRGSAQALLHKHPSKVTITFELDLTFFEKKNLLICKTRFANQASA